MYILHQHLESFLVFTFCHETELKNKFVSVWLSSTGNGAKTPWGPVRPPGHLLWHDGPGVQVRTAWCWWWWWWLWWGWWWWHQQSVKTQGCTSSTFTSFLTWQSRCTCTDSMTMMVRMMVVSRYSACWLKHLLARIVLHNVLIHVTIAHMGQFPQDGENVCFTVFFF